MPKRQDRLAGPTRPLGSPEIPQFHLPTAGGPRGVFTPRLYGAARIQFGGRQTKVRRNAAGRVPRCRSSRDSRTVDWDLAQPTRRDARGPAEEPAARRSYLPLPAARWKLKTFTRWAKNFDRWLARTQRLEVPPKTEGAEDVSLGPKRGGVSVELVAIVWELA